MKKQQTNFKIYIDIWYIDKSEAKYIYFNAYDN